LLLRRAEFLHPRDRDLLEAIMVRGQTVNAVGRLTGTDPRYLRKYIAGLTSRMGSRAFTEAIRAMPHLSEKEAQMARLYFCQGLSIRRLCCGLFLSEYVVRRRLDMLRARIATIAQHLAEGARRPGRKASAVVSGGV
jgi:hypothetical protein